MRRGWTLVAIAVLAFGVAPNGRAAVLNVPATYPTVQAAIDAASDGDEIRVAPGAYPGRLTITKSVQVVGAGRALTLIYSAKQSPVAAVSGPHTVTLQGIEMNGGEPLPLGGTFAGVSAVGLSVDEAAVTLRNVAVSNVSGTMIAASGASLDCSDVALLTRQGGTAQTAMGFGLTDCAAALQAITQTTGRVVQSIAIDSMNTASAVTIEACVLRASSGATGDCVVSAGAAQLAIRDCVFYRAAGGAPVSGSAACHTGVAIAGADVTAVLSGNQFENLPWGVVIDASTGGALAASLDTNQFDGCAEAAVLIVGMDSEGVDLGGGSAGSTGGNVFSNSGGYDVALHQCAANVWARHNAWSADPPADKIHDRGDDEALGEVVVVLRPSAAFGADRSGGTVPLEVTFADESDPGDDTITEWLWDFGDGTTSNEQHPVHTYSEEGVFTVSLTVTGAAGAATETKQDFLTVIPPVTPPDNVSASDGTFPDRVRISWSAVEHAERYGIYRSLKRDPATAQKIGESTETSWDDTSALGGSGNASSNGCDGATLAPYYYYWVVSMDAYGGASEFSEMDRGFRGVTKSRSLASAANAVLLVAAVAIAAGIPRNRR